MPRPVFHQQASIAPHPLELPFLVPQGSTVLEAAVATTIMSLVQQGPFYPPLEPRLCLPASHVQPTLWPQVQGRALAKPVRQGPSTIVPPRALAVQQAPLLLRDLISAAFAWRAPTAHLALVPALLASLAHIPRMAMWRLAPPALLEHIPSTTGEMATEATVRFGGPRHLPSVG